jgi:7,8-dihydropterin-6-yl-methyl-4-(beta-D-ribofuranosyl)aminobenzene 5'-phosphate synthase
MAMRWIFHRNPYNQGGAMQKLTRREMLQKGGRLAAGAAIGTTCLPLLGCSVGSEHIDSFPPEALTPADLEDLKLSVLYDNCYFEEGLKVDWGFACLVEGLAHTILFDTGRHDTFLLSNMEVLGVDPARIDDIVISHKHMDHTGGLDTLIEMKVGKNVCLVKSITMGLRGKLADYGATLTEIDDPVVIAKGALSTGAMKRVLISEQGLLIPTSRGVILIVGCSHPGIVEMVARARRLTGMEILLVIGGFHLLNHYAPDVEEIVLQFKDLGVKYVAATHCTGRRPAGFFPRVTASITWIAGPDALLRPGTLPDPFVFFNSNKKGGELGSELGVGPW